jgi:hypothetical protein
LSIPIDVEGPVEAEVLVVVERDGGPWLTGPCGPAPWRIEGAGADPTAVVARLAADALDDVLLVHSTSWRWVDGTVVLTYLVVVGSTDLDVAPIRHVALARSDASAAPTTIASNQVLEHALRHLAWLAKEDDVVRDVLSQSWHAILEGYVPEPFQHLEGT